MSNRAVEYVSVGGSVGGGGVGVFLLLLSSVLLSSTGDEQIFGHKIIEEFRQTEKYFFDIAETHCNAAAMSNYLWEGTSIK